MYAKTDLISAAKYFIHKGTFTINNLCVIDPLIGKIDDVTHKLSSALVFRISRPEVFCKKVAL